ncbi:MAG: hypothetical protein BroJett003_09190 [Planctomycetota bacterium]|nr:MAG: hypothetical protein BroJett003_09190 [Planctomycetota bacterium]
MFTALAFLWFLFGTQFASPQKPVELIEAERYRGRMETGRVDWVLTPPQRDGGVDSQGLYSSRLAYADLMESYYGLADGRGHANAEPGQPFSFGEMRFLMKDGEQWRFYADSVDAGIIADPGKFFHYRNLRDLGFEPTPALSTVEAFYRQPAASYDPAEHHEDRVTVTGHWDNGMSVRWTLDPGKGMQPVRVEMLSGSEVLGACDSEYEEFDGLWFPKRCTFSHRGSTTVTIGVLSAEFNRPEHPKELTPKDLGMVPGVQIHHPERGNVAWTGEELIPLEDWLRMASAGEVDISTWQALLKHCQSPTGLGRYPKRLDDDFLGLTSTVTRKPGLWEDYTRRFIQRFRLEGEQIDRAWTHLKECQKPAYAYLDEQKSVIREAETERAKVAAELAKVEAELAKGDTDRATPGANPSPSTGAKEKSTSGAKEKSSSAEKEKSSAGAGTKDETSAGGSSQERSAAQAPDPASADAADDARVKQRAAFQEQLGKLDERLKKLYEPIEKIFEEKLKPGLAKLPTQAQIDAARAREAETSRTAAQPSGTAAEP